MKSQQGTQKTDNNAGCSRLLEKMIRIVTLPAIDTGVLIVLLWQAAKAISGLECLLSEVFLVFIPLLAYPFGAIWHKNTDIRSAQRKAAFAFSIAGYAAGTIWAFALQHSVAVRVLFGSYMLSVIVLALVNKLCRFKASGHACSAMAPLVLLTWQLGFVAAPACVLLVAAVYYSSIKLKRHTLLQLVVGSAISVVASLICIVIL